MNIGIFKDTCERYLNYLDGLYFQNASIREKQKILKSLSAISDLSSLRDYCSDCESDLSKLQKNHWSMVWVLLFIFTFPFSLLFLMIRSWVKYKNFDIFKTDEELFVKQIFDYFEQLNQELSDSYSAILSSFSSGEFSDGVFNTHLSEPLRNHQHHIAVEFPKNIHPILDPLSGVKGISEEVRNGFKLLLEEHDSILLHGPMGAGKHHLVQSFFKNLTFPLIKIEYGEIAYLEQVFGMIDVFLQENQVILLIEDIDILNNKDGMCRRFLLEKLQDIGNQHLICIGITHDIQKMHPEFRQFFVKELEISKPHGQAYRQIIKDIIFKVKESLNIQLDEAFMHELNANDCQELYKYVEGYSLQNLQLILRHYLSKFFEHESTARLVLLQDFISNLKAYRQNMVDLRGAGPSYAPVFTNSI